jgi:hypothetical protein
MPTKQEEFRLAESKLLEGIHSLEIQAMEQQALLYKLHAEYSESVCPLKIGQIVKHTGYSHTGKMVRITHHIPTDGRWSYTPNTPNNWGVIATVLKKDGSDSTFTVEIHGYTEPQN